MIIGVMFFEAVVFVFMLLIMFVFFVVVSSFRNACARQSGDFQNLKSIPLVLAGFPRKHEAPST